MTKLKNAYSSKPINNIFRDIEKILVTHKAQRIMKEYENAQVIGISFTIQVRGMYIPIKLPARLKECRAVLKSQGFKYSDEQIYRVSWRNIEDWIASQMAMIDLDMVKIEEIFLPL